MYTCDFCGKEFETNFSFAAHIGHCNKKPKCLMTYDEYSAASKKGKLTYIKNHPEIYVKKPRTLICNRCGREYILNLTDNEYNRGKYMKYCSLECRNTRTFSEETKRKISDSLKKWNSTNSKENKKKKVNLKKYKCKVCGKEFTSKEERDCSGLLYCSKKCKHEFLSANTGGYRKGSGNGKHGYYKGIKCDSTYELAYLIYCIDNGISIKRYDGYFVYEYKNKKHKYFPDFEVNGTIIEIKGYHTDVVDVKEKSVNLPIKILYRKDLDKEFDYVCKTYGVNEHNIYTLYDDHKPKYEYACNNCSNAFYTDRKRKTELKFCSRQCSMRYAKEISFRPKHLYEI